MEADFSGYATKAGLKCSDGRTIMPDAFKHMDGKTVPLVWQHGHGDPTNVLGHALLEAREDGLYAYGFFNKTDTAKHAKSLVEHKDIVSLSIYANQLVERSKQVFHGVVRELSLVLSGANPGALIDNVRIAHGDGDVTELSDEVIIFTGLELTHSEQPSGSNQSDTSDDNTDDSDSGQSDGADSQDSESDQADDDESDDSDGGEVQHAAGDDDTTLQEMYDTLSEDQKKLVHYMIGAALEAAKTDSSAAQSAISDDNEGDLNHQEGTGTMPRNVFEQNGARSDSPSLSHSQLETIIEDAKKNGSLKESFLAHAVEYGIQDIDILFPDAKSVTSTPELLARRMEWVSVVMDGTKKSPFARIKSTVADITADEARAKGYVKGNRKKEEIVKLLKRVTTPTTIYKKQKLDRDDIVDITDLDVVAWLKGEMRLMLDEELAGAVLIGDGREPDDEDKIDEDHIRPIAFDDDMYTHKVTLASNATPRDTTEAVIRARTNYKGTGTPTMFTTDAILIDLLLQEDKVGRRLYDSVDQLAATLRVSRIVPVEVLDRTPEVLAIIVNLADYTLGADRGGNVSMFDDFDIDYNQYKYLIETRVSGALTKPKSAVVIRRTTGTAVVATAPTFDSPNNKLTIPTVAGVSYFDVTSVTGPGVELTDGETYHLTDTVEVEARADAGSSFGHNVDNDWTFVFNADGDTANAAADPTLPSA
jgi:hypothetical protein